MRRRRKGHPLKQTLFRAAFWLAALFALVMAILPDPMWLPGNPGETFRHVLAFVVLSALGYFAYPGATVMRLGISLAAFGAMIEVIQGLPFVGRDADFKDLAVDTAAVIATLLVLKLVWHRFPNGRGDEANDAHAGTAEAD